LDRIPTLGTNIRLNPFSKVLTVEGLLNRPFFITARGYFGLGAKSVVSRDKISILLGAATPYVLRDQGDHQIIVG
jgi:hypothetical protein